MICERFIFVELMLITDCVVVDPTPVVGLFPHRYRRIVPVQGV